jgi:16S rRNA (uracil1498-N3)-methyltransferase
LKNKTIHHNQFFVSQDGLGQDRTVCFSRSESRHMVRSLRIKKGDLVTATDGRGHVYRILVEDASSREVRGRIERSEHVARSGARVHIFQAVIRPARMELIVEKATELGVWGLTPVKTSRSKGMLGAVRIERLRKTAIEAVKQSLGAYVPEITGVLGMDEGLEMSRGFDLLLVAHEGGDAPTMREALEAYNGGSIALWIGPEGGLSDSETRALGARGGIGFTLG